MATSVDTTTSGSSEDTPEQPGFDGGFVFQSPDRGAQRHIVEIEYSRIYTDEIRIRDGEVSEERDNDGNFCSDGTIKCSCGEEFADRNEATKHIETYQQRFFDPAPIPETSPSILFEDEPADIFEGCVSIRGRADSAIDAIAVVESGSDYLAATARETFQPPANHDFENWEPLTDGRLTHHYGDEPKPMFRATYLKQALRVLTGGRSSYQPERYTVFFRGENPLYIEGGGKGVLIAPVIPNR